MILVTDANGLLGRHIVSHLRIALGTADGLAASVREAGLATGLAERGIDVRPGDPDRPEELLRAFTGVDKLVLVAASGPQATRQARHRHAIAAAQAAGVEHIVYTSSLDVAADSPSEVAAVHRATEADLAASGLKVTVLRCTLHADCLPMAVGDAARGGIFRLPAGNGRASFVCREELAQAIAAATLAPALAQDVYELTGQTTHDYGEVAAAIAQACGKPVRYEPIAPEDYARTLADYGLPGWLASAPANIYAAVAAGKFARVSNDFAALVGHPPRPLACLVQELFGPH